MRNLRTDLIHKELEKDINQGFIFKPLKLSNKFIDRLFNHYYCHEMCENFYDSCPNFEGEELDELYNMYLDYNNSFKMDGRSFWEIISNYDEIEEKKEKFKFSKHEHTKEELKEAYYKVKQMYADYEEKRIIFCNWQEPYFEGNWGYSQEYVDSVSKSTLKHIQKKINVPRKDRLYYAEKDNQIRIYFYGRDFMEVDYWFIFMKRKHRN